MKLAKQIIGKMEGKGNMIVDKDALKFKAYLKAADAVIKTSKDTDLIKLFSKVTKANDEFEKYLNQNY